MNRLQLSGWALLIAVGCNGQITVSDGVGGAAGSAGARDFGSTAGKNGVAGHGGTAGENVNGSAGHAGVGTPFTPPGEGGGCSYSCDWGPFGGGGGYGGSGSEGGGYAGHAHGGFYGVGGGLQGNLGQACFLGGLLTEADGSPAKAQIRTLPHCDEGFKCVQDECVPVPDCPQSTGLCVVRRAALGEGNAGSPGASGASNNSVGSGGGGQTVYNSVELSGVTALTASESHVYWVEYGTRDALGNYQHDGALLAYAIADGTTTVVASALEGPIDVELTTSHAYIYIDGARPLNTPIHSQLLRVPLSGGTAELVQEGARPASFAAAGSKAFWSRNYTEGTPNIYSLESDANAVPTVFVAAYANALASDATDLYYLSDQGLMRSPIASAAPVVLGASPGAFVLHDDSIFSLESVTAGGLLQRGPKSGGDSLRVRALGSGTPSELQAVGDRYFLSVAQSGNWTPSGFAYYAQVLTAGFVGTDPPIRLLERTKPITSPDQLWVGTASDLYWSEGRTIYKQPL